MNSPTRDLPGPVLIVGAGPAGLVAALELRKWDVPVTIIDALSTPRTESRAGGIQPRTLELLDRYDVTERLIAHRRGPNQYIMYYNGQEVSRIDMSLARSRYSAPPSVPQAIFEGILRDAVAAAGVDILWQHELLAVEQNEEGATAHIRTPDGDLTFRADFVLGCDGARSTARKVLGLDFAGTSHPQSFGLMDARLQWDNPPDALRIFRHDGPQQIVVVPYGDDEGIWRLQIDQRPSEYGDSPPTVQEMQEVFDRVTGLKGKISDPTWASGYRVHLRQVVTYSRGRVYLAGDAAHIHSPAGAQGLNTGVHDAINLGWKLGLVLRGKAQPDLLTTYEAERQPIAEGVLKFSDRFMRNAAAVASSPNMPPHLLVDSMSQLLVNYRQGPLGSHADGQPGSPPTAGDRLPDVEIDGVSVYRGLRDAKVVVALFGEQAAGSDAAGVFARFGDAVTVWHQAAGDPLAEALGITTGAAVIRPDAFLGLVTKGEVWDAATEVGDWLQATLRLVPTHTHSWASP